MKSLSTKELRAAKGSVPIRNITLTRAEFERAAAIIAKAFPSATCDLRNTILELVYRAPASRQLCLFGTQSEVATISSALVCYRNQQKVSPTYNEVQLIGCAARRMVS